MVRIEQNKLIIEYETHIPQEELHHLYNDLLQLCLDNEGRYELNDPKRTVYCLLQQMIPSIDQLEKVV